MNSTDPWWTDAVQQAYKAELGAAMSVKWDDALIKAILDEVPDEITNWLNSMPDALLDAGVMATLRTHHPELFL